MAFLEVRNISRRFGGLKAVEDVSFNVTQGHIKALIGPNGAGKTTLFNLISGHLPADKGTVLFENEWAHGLKPYKMAQMGMARTFQHTKLFSRMTALENVLVGRHVKTSTGFFAGAFDTPWKRREDKASIEKARSVMEFTGIAELQQHESTSLAFGQQRLLEIARALALEPKLLLLDEPAAGLNMKETRAMSELITRVRDTGVTVLLVEHDMSLVMDISDEILVLCYGEKIADGTPGDIQKDPEVLRVYLGEDDDA